MPRLLLAFTFAFISMIDIASEIKLQTTRSGGKGGQNVNKVETAVIAVFPLMASQLLSDAQKIIIKEKLANRINKEGSLVVKAQQHRTQLENKAEVIKTVNALINRALTRKKLRISTKPGKAAREKRINEKKIISQRKSARQRPDWNDSQ